MLLSAVRAAALGAVALPPPTLERMGTHIILEVFDAPYALLNSTTAQLAALRAAAVAGGLSVVGELVHQFPVMGASTILLISESHLSIHAWPERGYASVDLFTCGAAQPLPCRQHEPARFGSDTGWACASGAPVATDLDSGLWMAVQALLSSLRAQGAMLTWMDRGLPSFAKAAATSDAPPPSPSQGVGWLGGLEREASVEL